MTVAVAPSCLEERVERREPGSRVGDLRWRVAGPGSRGAGRGWGFEGSVPRQRQREGAARSSAERRASRVAGRVSRVEYDHTILLTDISG